MRNKGMTSSEKKRKITFATNKFIKDNKLVDSETVIIGRMSDNDKIGKIDTIKTGNVAFDVLTGGGLLDGKINIIFGGAGCGKSTFVRDTVDWTTREHDAFHCYLNSEKSMDRNYWADKISKLDNVIIGEFENSEQGPNLCIKCATGELPVDILTIDTLQALSPESELETGKGKDKSVADNSVALIPRLYSQFTRMYTSKNTGLTLLLVSQVRTRGIGTKYIVDDMTGGNALKHYNLLTVEMTRSNSKISWPYSVDKLPPNSFTVTYKLYKIKKMGRYDKLSIKAYFVNGSFDRRFNIIAIGKDLGVFNGKEFEYPNPENTNEMILYKCAGLNDAINGKGNRKMPKEAVEYMETLLEQRFTYIANQDLTSLNTNNEDNIDTEIEEISLNTNNEDNIETPTKTKKVSKNKI